MESVLVSDAMAFHNAQARQVQADFDRKWGKIPMGEELEQQQRAGQQALLRELGQLIDQRFEQAVRDTQTALQEAQQETAQQKAAIATHEGMRPGLGASPSDIRGWSGERALLADMLSTYVRNEAAAASAYQQARERLQAAMRSVYERRRAELELSIEVEWRNDIAEVDAKRAEADRLLAAAQAAHHARQQQLNTLVRYFPGA